MASTGGHYDETLLASAPAATKAQIQDGYNPDLLKPNRAQATPPPNRDPEAAVSKEQLSYAAPLKIPFWRTRKGIIIIVIAIVVIIAVVVGGAVGGSNNKNHASNKTTQPFSSAAGPSSTSSDSGQQVTESTASSTSTAATTKQSSGPGGSVSTGPSVEEVNVGAILQGIQHARAVAR